MERGALPDQYPEVGFPTGIPAARSTCRLTPHTEIDAYGRSLRVETRERYSSSQELNAYSSCGITLFEATLVQKTELQIGPLRLPPRH